MKTRKENPAEKPGGRGEKKVSRPGLATHSYNPNTKTEAGGSLEAQAQPRHTEFKATLNYPRSLCLQKTKKRRSLKSQLTAHRTNTQGGCSSPIPVLSSFSSSSP